MPENTFDIVSKIDLQEVSNAIQHALKEIHTRFDLKDSKSNIELEGKDAIVLHSLDEFKLKAVNDVFQQKLAKRGVPLKGLTYGAVEAAAGGTAKQRITMQQGIPIEKAQMCIRDRVDIVCSAVGREALGVDEIVCSPLNVGGGLSLIHI